MYNKVQCILMIHVYEFQFDKEVYNIYSSLCKYYNIDTNAAAYVTIYTV